MIPAMDPGIVKFGPRLELAANGNKVPYQALVGKLVIAGSITTEEKRTVIAWSFMRAAMRAGTRVKIMVAIA